MLIAPVLAFALAATGYLALRCTVTGVVMAEACCPPPAAREKTPGQPGGHDSLGDPACCQRLVIETGKIPAVVSERPVDLPDASVALADPSALTLEPPAPPRRHFALRVAEPRSVAAPHFLLSHSFLI
jgi:hypothetical protein